MKNIFYLPVVLSVVACVQTEPANQQEQKEPSVNIEQVVNTIDSKLITNADPFEIATIYTNIFRNKGSFQRLDMSSIRDFPASIHEDLEKVKTSYSGEWLGVDPGDVVEGKISCDDRRYLKYGSENSLGIMLGKKMLKPELLNDNLLFECFTEDPGSSQHNLNQSDECIIYRRTHSVPSMCGLNYSKYLPAITTDLQFYTVVAMVKQAKWNFGKCDQMSDITTSERAICKQKYVDFVNDFINKKAQSCKQSHPKEWQKLLTDVKEAVKDQPETYEYVSKGIDKIIKTTQTELFLLIADIAEVDDPIKERYIRPVLHESIEEEFQWEFLCLPDYNDLNNVIKKGLKECKTKSKIGKVITLN